MPNLNGFAPSFCSCASPSFSAERLYSKRISSGVVRFVTIRFPRSQVSKSANSSSGDNAGWVSLSPFIWVVSRSANADGLAPFALREERVVGLLEEMGLPALRNPYDRLNPTPKRLHGQRERRLGLPRHDGRRLRAPPAPAEREVVGLDGEKLGHGHAPGCGVARLRRCGCRLRQRQSSRTLFFVRSATYRYPEG